MNECVQIWIVYDATWMNDGMEPIEPSEFQTHTDHKTNQQEDEKK